MLMSVTFKSTYTSPQSNILFHLHILRICSTKVYWRLQNRDSYTSMMIRTSTCSWTIQNNFHSSSPHICTWLGTIQFHRNFLVSRETILKVLYNTAVGGTLSGQCSDRWNDGKYRIHRQIYYYTGQCKRGTILYEGFLSSAGICVCRSVPDNLYNKWLHYS